MWTQNADAVGYLGLIGLALLFGLLTIIFVCQLIKHAELQYLLDSFDEFAPEEDIDTASNLDEV